MGEAETGNICIKMSNPVNGTGIIYRNEGKYPSRGDPFAVIRQWRESRRDIFKNTTGVLTEENEEWQRVRSLIQQDMMRPKSAMFYINQLQDVSRDFVELCRRKRDANGVMQHNHLVDYHNFGIESIALIALDTRLGCLSENTTDENKKAIDSARTIINEMGDLMMGVPMYKLGKWASPRYRKFSNAADDLADFVLVSILPSFFSLYIYIFL